MKTRQLAVALVAALPLAAAAGSSLRDGRPEWTNGESLEWPRHKYVLGVGVADDRTTAEERARAEVARVFSTKVVATTSVYAAESGRTTGGVTTMAQERSVSDDTRSTTEKDLVGVEIAATWQDPATRQVFVLATLDRRQAASRVQARLDALDAEIAPIGKVMSGGERLAAGLAALRYRALARQREPLVADLAVLQPGDREGATKTAALDGAATSALGRLVVASRVTGDPGRVLTAGVTKGLATAGLTARADEGGETAADLVVSVDTSVEDLGQRDGWFWTRVTASVVVREAASGRTLIELSESDRQATTAASEGRSRALKALAAKLATRIPGELANAPTR